MPSVPEYLWRNFVFSRVEKVVAREMERRGSLRDVIERTYLAFRGTVDLEIVYWAVREYIEAHEADTHG